MEAVPMPEATDRLTRLERAVKALGRREQELDGRVRRLRGWLIRGTIALTLILLGAGAALLAPRAGSGIRQRIEVRSVLLVNDAGQDCGALGATTKGGMLVLRSTGGKGRLRMGAPGGDAGIDFLDDSGRVRMSLGVAENRLHDGLYWLGGDDLIQSRATRITWGDVQSRAEFGGTD